MERGGLLGFESPANLQQDKESTFEVYKSFPRAQQAPLDARHEVQHQGQRRQPVSPRPFFTSGVRSYNFFDHVASITMSIPAPLGQLELAAPSTPSATLENDRQYFRSNRENQAPLENSTREIYNGLVGSEVEIERERMRMQPVIRDRGREEAGGKVHCW